MIFDVMVRTGMNENGKQVVNVFRVHDRILSQYLRQAQDSGKYIISVIPLFKAKKEEVYGGKDPIDPDSMIDPHGF